MRMEDLEKTSFDIDELARKIDERIKELEKLEEEKKQEKYVNEDLEDNISSIDQIIKEIDRRIQELEQEEELNIDDLTSKINAKLESLDEFDVEDDLEKTKYDLEEIAKQINETIKMLEKKKKDKKRKKAMYCDMARRNERKKKGNRN